MESTNPSWANLQAGRPEQCTTAGERPERATYTSLPSLLPSLHTCTVNTDTLTDAYKWVTLELNLILLSAHDHMNTEKKGDLEIFQINISSLCFSDWTPGWTRLSLLMSIRLLSIPHSWHSFKLRKVPAKCYPILHSPLFSSTVVTRLHPSRWTKWNIHLVSPYFNPVLNLMWYARSHPSPLRWQTRWTRTLLLFALHLLLFQSSRSSLSEEIKSLLVKWLCLTCTHWHVFGLWAW